MVMWKYFKGNKKAIKDLKINLAKNFFLNYAIQKVVSFYYKNIHNITHFKHIEILNTTDSNILDIIKEILLSPKLILMIIDLLLKKVLKF